jgi:hypothetical protein
MRSQLHTRWPIVAVAVLVAAIVVPTALARTTPASGVAPDGWAMQYASPSSTDGWADQIVDPYGTLALRENEATTWADQIVDPYGTLALRESGVGGQEFIPGVTDSTTGVARELERKGLEPRVIPSSPSVDDSGFHVNDAVIGMGAVLGAAILMAASAALFAGERRRRRPAI